MTLVKHLTYAELEIGIDAIRQSFQDDGVLRMIVRRPAVDQRVELDSAELDKVEGLVGDNWKTRSKSPHPDMQLTIMNSRSISLIAGDKERWALAGDQLFIDLDLSVDNLPPGTRLAVGAAVIEVTEVPHTGCRKFAARFGSDAVKFVNSDVGRRMQLRGINAKVIQPGAIQVGDTVKKFAKLET